MAKPESGGIFIGGDDRLRGELGGETAVGRGPDRQFNCEFARNTDPLRADFAFKSDREFSALPALTAREIYREPD
jgi:hypothetical protein